MGRYLREQEEERVRAQERARADRRVKTVEEKRKSDRAKFKAASREAHAEHSEELSVALTKARVALSREAAAKVQLEKAQEQNRSLLLKLKIVEELNESVVEGLAEIIARTGDIKSACGIMHVKPSKFDYWMTLGQSDVADPIYRYLNQEVTAARAAFGEELVDKLKDMSKDVFEDIFRDGEVVGKRVARRGDSKPLMFLAERLLPESFAPRTASPLPAEKAPELPLELYSEEEFERHRRREQETEADRKMLAARKQSALQNANPNKVVDTDGEDVTPSKDE